MGTKSPSLNSGRLMQNARYLLKNVSSQILGQNVKQLTI